MNWYDWVRVVVACLCATSLFILLKRYRAHNQKWNEKTKDYWFSLVMWVLAGLIGSAQGAFYHNPLGPSLIFSIAAGTVTLKGLLRKGEWGGSDA